MRRFLCILEHLNEMFLVCILEHLNETFLVHFGASQ